MRALLRGLRSGITLPPDCHRIGRYWTLGILRDMDMARLGNFQKQTDRAWRIRCGLHADVPSLGPRTMMIPTAVGKLCGGENLC